MDPCKVSPPHELGKTSALLASVATKNCCTQGDLNLRCNVDATKTKALTT
jgi:hypothetical protein